MTTITPIVYNQDVEDLSACNVDLGFIIDESASMTESGYRQAIAFVEKIVSNFTLGPNHTRVSLMTFSTFPFPHFGFNDVQSTDFTSFKNYLATIPYLEGFTYTNQALDLARTTVFNKFNGDRPDYRSVAVVLTDGKSSSDISFVEEASSKLLNSAVKVLVVGVGSGVVQAELEAIAGDKFNIFSVSGNDQLNSLVEAILPPICKDIFMDLQCESYGFAAGFSLVGLSVKPQPYTIRFAGSGECGTFNANSSDNIYGGRLWMTSNYTDCGVEAYHSGDQIVFEKQIIVLYGKNESNLIYRHSAETYSVQCTLDRRLTEKLNINVKDIGTNPYLNGTSEFSLKMKVTKPGDDKEIQMVTINEPLEFQLDIVDAPNAVKTSPQDCYATRADGSGRYNLITDRCEDDETTAITSSKTAIHRFSWEMLAFRYFGNSNAVIIVCEVLICKNDDFADLSGECKRCGQTSNRKRRAVSDSLVLEKTTISSQPIFIIDLPNNPEQSSAQKDEGFLAKAEGISVIAVLVIVILGLGAFILMKKMVATSSHLMKKTLQVEGNVEKGVDNMAME
ncbi:cuticlin-6-like isoform X3 [Clytia hemisphaerica]|uniref:cuticlin-6-like isoform X3 n=1 Tax=Clytia hemisphaerica TaxID=252671 RepID=UPI0034D60B6C